MPILLHPTVHGSLVAGAKHLTGSETPERDAQLLLHAVTGRSRTDFYAAPEATLTPDEISRYTELLERRARGEPIAYLLGRREFWSLELSVTASVLIPRPETELVVERALARMKSEDAILDLGTGSGAIALAVAYERPRSSVTAVDVSVEALTVARENAMQLGITNVRFLQGNWYEPVRGSRYALILSNPPYIAANDPHLDPRVSRYEPHMALIAGTTGFEALEHIIAHAPAYLEPGGGLIVEHGWQQAVRVRTLLEKAGFAHVVSHADLAGHERVTEGRRP